MSECKFCNDAALKQQLITENDLASVIYARCPLTPGHVLVIPKIHHPDFLSLSPDETVALMSLIQKMTYPLMHAYNSTGLNVFANVGPSAGQHIPHLHLHLIPRAPEEKQNPLDTFNHPEDHPERKRLDAEEINTEIKKIREALFAET